MVAIQDIFQKEEFVNALTLFEPYISMQKVREEYLSYRSTYDFQLGVAKGFVDYFIHQTTAGVSLKGLENIQKDKAYLFVGNHRDIVFDTALLQYYFMVNRYATSRIAIGDNLLSHPLLEIIGKINKMITVNRSLSLREKLANYKQMSEYIYYSIHQELQSIWIAQRNGRTKDGIDQTQQGLVKMFSMYHAKSPREALAQLHIVPVTVSYEYEPCDKLKARELALSENGVYEKTEGEDFESIKQGLFGQKGKVILTIGTPLDREISEITETDPKKIIEQVCLLIDSQIFKNYHLFASNYIAADYIESSTQHARHYSTTEKASFLNYIEKQSAIQDVPIDKMKNYLLHIYANPVKMVLEDLNKK